MLPLLSGLVIFVAVHLLPSHPRWRGALIERIGTGAYLALFSLVSLAGLVLMIRGKSAAPVTLLWQPPAWGHAAALLLMLPAAVLLAGAYLPGNLKRFTAHPMLWAVTLWSTAHLLANSDLASVVLFGGLGAFALLDMWLANRRGARPATRRHSHWLDAGAVTAGVAAYAVLLYLHPLLFGVAVLAP